MKGNNNRNASTLTGPPSIELWGGCGRSFLVGRWTGSVMAADQRDALLDAFEQSGQSATAFCRQHGLKYPTFATRVQKHRRRTESS